MEDAYPVERYALELLLPYAYERHRGGGELHVWTLEAAYGLLANMHLGLKAPLTDRGLAGLRAFALYNLNTESPLLPAVSLRADAGLPVGPLGGDEPRLALKAIATRSWGATRLHVNAAYGVGPDGAVAAAEGIDRWWYGAGVDRTLLRHSLLLGGELYAARPNDGEPVEVNATLGLRWQWRPTVVLDFGARRRLGSAGPDLAVTLGVSKSLGWVIGGRPRSGSPTPHAPRPTVDRRNEQFYHPGSFNWALWRRYPAAARLFNAFDYGHAVLYERLYTAGDSARAAAALAREYRYLTTDLLVRPPRFAIAEEAVEPAYAKLAWRAKLMFDWAHVLHRQIYDVYADPRIAGTAKIALVERLTDYYLSRPDVAFVPVPKSMALMDEQYYSNVFRRRYPEFNGLIWAYHWLQIGLYEPLIAAADEAGRAAGVSAALARFREMLADPPRSMPREMPLTVSVAPRFTARHARAAAIFDNLHMMHDIISDILAADTVPRARKRAVIYEALREFSDSTRNVMTPEEWGHMGHHMGGVDAMGGPVPVGR